MQKNWTKNDRDDDDKNVYLGIHSWRFLSVAFAMGMVEEVSGVNTAQMCDPSKTSFFIIIWDEEIVVIITEHTKTSVLNN